MSESANASRKRGIRYNNRPETTVAVANAGQWAVGKKPRSITMIIINYLISVENLVARQNISYTKRFH